MSTPRHKVSKVPEHKEIHYPENNWRLLNVLRNEALKLMKILIKCNFYPILHGSLARGDVNANSDIDIVIPYNIRPYEVETCLENNNLIPINRYIIQATPSSALKAYIELEHKGLKNISFPLTPLSSREHEFYRFGGLINYHELVKGLRVPGVNKQLILIVPKPYGHDEYPVIGYEGYVAKLIGVSLETVKERIEVLSRRDEYGRTGVYLKYVLMINESFDEALVKLIKGKKHMHKLFNS